MPLAAYRLVGDPDQLDRWQAEAVDQKGGQVGVGDVVAGDIEVYAPGAQAAATGEADLGVEPYAVLVHVPTVRHTGRPSRVFASPGSPTAGPTPARPPARSGTALRRQRWNSPSMRPVQPSRTGAGSAPSTSASIVA